MEDEAKRDRISEMPREIKEKILLSLSMKDAICTCFLSSVWRYSWISLPFLDFGFDFFCQFISFFRTLPTTHPKKRHLYSIFHDEVVVEDNSESTVDGSGSGSGSGSVYNDWLVKRAWEIEDVGYLQMIHEFLQVYIEKNQSLRVLKKISLHVPILSDSKMRAYGADIVSRCLSLAKHNVTELDYEINNLGLPYYSPQKDSYYALQNCLPILESKTITKLKLRGCYLATEEKVDISIDLPNLKHLRLQMFNVKENMLETLFAKCQALEKLCFSFCKGFKVLRIPRLLKLKKLQVKHIHDLDLLEINALEIQRLTLYNLDTNKCKITMASNSCNNLVNLFVYGCGITDDFFNNVSEFPHLKTVCLIDCPKLNHIKISSNSLTSLDIKKCPNLSQPEVDTPNLFFGGGYSNCSNNIIKRISSKGRIRYF